MKVSHSLLLLTFQTGSYDLNPEEMMTFKGKNTSRYSYLVQGHENPYFLPGDEKKNWNENTKTYKWARKTGSKRSNWFETLGLQIHILRRVIYKDTLPSELICINDESQMTFKKRNLENYQRDSFVCIMSALNGYNQWMSLLLLTFIYSIITVFLTTELTFNPYFMLWWIQKEF